MAKNVLKINFASLVRRKEEAMNLNRRLTQKELAEALDITPPTVRKWMRGNVGKFTVDQLERYLDYFDCNIEDLLIQETVEDGPLADS